MTNNNVIETKVPFLRKITPFDKDGEAGKIVFVWGDGITTELDMNEVSEQNKIRSQYHGLSQRLGDSVAGCSKDSAYGYARETMGEIINLLKTADWTKPAKGGSGKIETPIMIDDLIDVIAKLKKQPREKVETVVRTADRTTRDQWRNAPAVSAELATLIAKRAKESAKESGDFDFPLE